MITEPYTFPAPRVLVRPENIAGSMGDAIAYEASMCDLFLDDHQRLVLDSGLAYTDKTVRLRDHRVVGAWAATQVGYFEPRQNGKSRLLVARMLGGSTMLRERTIVFSAHEVKTAMEIFGVLSDYVTNYDHLRKTVRRLVRTNGQEAIEFKNGRRILFLARTTHSGRGFSADLVVMDEAQQLAFSTLAAIMPTRSAIPNSQLWFAGTPPSQEMNGEVVTSIRRKAKSATPPSRLVWVEWSSGPRPGQDPATFDYADPANWLEANPACPDRIALESIEDEFNTMDEETFRRDRLGEWDDDSADTVIPMVAWERQTDADAEITERHTLVFDVSPDRSACSISIAGLKEDGHRHVEVLARGSGVDWVGDFLKRYLIAHPSTRAVAIDASSPAASLILPLQKLGIQLTLLQTRDVTMACGQAYDGFVGGEVTHAGQDVLTTAMAGSATREVQDAWALSRKRAETDITSFVAAVLALYAVQLRKVKRPLLGRRGKRSVVT